VLQLFAAVQRSSQFRRPYSPIAAQRWDGEAAMPGAKVELTLKKIFFEILAK